MSTLTKNKIDTVGRGSVLPVLTNRWLSVNDVETGITIDKKVPYAPLALNDELRADYEQKLEESGHGISKELLEQNKEYANVTNYLEVLQGDLHRIDLPLSEANNILVDRHQFVTNEGHCGSVILNTFSEDDAPAERNGVVYVDVKEDGILRLIVINRTNHQTVNNLSIVANIADGGILHLTQVELGGKISNVNYACTLEGYESRTNVSCANIGSGTQRLDLFYDIRHYGQFTDSDIQVNGALMDEAHKSFRGTIDFIKGSKGSKGNEEEFTILMSDKAHSDAVPLLLAGEHDVEGNHAASAGRIDEDMLFYIMSRGIDFKEAEGMIVEARMIPTLNRIPDEQLRKSIHEEIHERIVNR